MEVFSEYREPAEEKIATNKVHPSDVVVIPLFLAPTTSRPPSFYSPSLSSDLLDIHIKRNEYL